MAEQAYTYPVNSFGDDGKEYFIARFPGPVEFGSLQQPLLMNRKKPDIAPSEEDVLAEKARQIAKEKAMVRNPEKEKEKEEQRLLMQAKRGSNERRFPWIIKEAEQEDGRPGHEWEGVQEDKNFSQYAIFIGSKNGFRVIPASDWFSFRPKIATNITTAEQAEALMKKMNKASERVGSKQLSILADEGNWLTEQEMSARSERKQKQSGPVDRAQVEKKKRSLLAYKYGEGGMDEEEVADFDTVLEGADEEVADDSQFVDMLPDLSELEDEESKEKKATKFLSESGRHFSNLLTKGISGPQKKKEEVKEEEDEEEEPEEQRPKSSKRKAEEMDSQPQSQQQTAARKARRAKLEPEYERVRQFFVQRGKVTAAEFLDHFVNSVVTARGITEPAAVKAARMAVFDPIKVILKDIAIKTADPITKASFFELKPEFHNQ